MNRANFCTSLFSLGVVWRKEPIKNFHKTVAFLISLHGWRIYLSLSLSLSLRTVSRLSRPSFISRKGLGWRWSGAGVVELPFLLFPFSPSLFSFLLPSFPFRSLSFLPFFSLSFLPLLFKKNNTECMNKWSNKLMLLSLSSPLSEINKLKQQQQQAKQCLQNNNNNKQNSAYWTSILARQSTMTCKSQFCTHCVSSVVGQRCLKWNDHRNKHRMNDYVK